MRLLLAIVLATLLDLMFGVFSAHVWGKMVGYGVPWWAYTLSVWVALLPDMDVVQQLWRRRHSDSEHRQYTHYPLLMMSVMTLLGFIIAGLTGTRPLFWIGTFTINLVAHFLHDSMEENEGIRWLWPFSEKSAALLSFDREGKWRFLVIYPKGALPPMKVSDWLRTHYYRLSPKLGFELTLATMLLLVVLAW